MKSTVVNIVKEQNKMEDKTYINDLDVIKFFNKKSHLIKWDIDIINVK